MRIARLDGKKITYPDADAPLFGTQLYVKVEPDYDDHLSDRPADGTDDQISIQIDDEAAVIYHSKWFGGVCWFFFDVKLPKNFRPYTNLTLIYGRYLSSGTYLRLGSWCGERMFRSFEGYTLFKGAMTCTFDYVYGAKAFIKLQSSTEQIIQQIIVGEKPDDASLNVSVLANYDLYYYCFWVGSGEPSLDYEGWLGGYEIKPICSTLGIEPQKSKFYWVDRYGFIHTYYFEVTSITNGKGEKVEYSKTLQDTNANISYYKTSISQPKITKAFQSEDEDLKNIKDIATLGSAMYLEINDIPVDPSLISALVVPNEKGLSRLTFSVDFNVENKNVVLW